MSHQKETAVMSCSVGVLVSLLSLSMLTACGDDSGVGADAGERDAAVSADSAVMDAILQEDVVSPRDATADSDASRQDAAAIPDAGEDAPPVVVESPFQAEFDEEWERTQTYLRETSLSDNGMMPRPQHRYYDMRGFDGLLAMFQVTGEQDYLDGFFTFLDEVHQLRTRDEGENFGNDIYDDFLLPSESGVLGEYVLHETRGHRNVPKMLYILHAYPVLRTWTHPELGSYQDLYEEYSEWYAIHFWEKWLSRGANNLYRSRTWMTSHWAQFALYMEHIDTDPARLEQYRLFRAAFDGRDGVTWSDWRDAYGGVDRGGTSFRSQQRQDAGHTVWSGIWGNDSRVGDVAHTNAGVQYMVNNQLADGGFDVDEMTGLVATLNRLFDNSPDSDALNIPWRIDGRYDSSDDNRQFTQYGWVMLGRYDEALQERLLMMNREQATSSHYLLVLLGNLAYNHAYIENSLVYPEL